MRLRLGRARKSYEGRAERPAVLRNGPAPFPVSGRRPARYGCLAVLDDLQQRYDCLDMGDLHSAHLPPARQLPAFCRDGRGMVKKTLSAVIFVSGEGKLPSKGHKLRLCGVAQRTSTGGSALAEKLAATRKPPAERKRQMEDAVAYALGHPIRNQALSILAEGKRSTSELAKIMGEDVKAVGHHIRELYESGCIEDAGTVMKGNVTERFYRVVILPYITDEAYQAMTMEERRDIIGVTVQSILTETLASYRAGKMESDEDLWLLWDALNLDARGRREVADELAASYERLLDIKCRAATRMTESGETGTTTIVTATAFSRCRSGRPERSYTPSTED